MKPKIILFKAALPSKLQRDKLESLADFHQFDAEGMTESDFITAAKDAEIVAAAPAAVGRLGEGFFSALPNLKFLCALSSGVDWIDVSAAHEQGITVANIKGVNVEPVAEHAWGMVLDLAKRITESDRSLREISKNDWRPWQGRTVEGKTLGIIGLGGIGKRIAEIASPFHMRILATSKSMTPSAGVEMTNLERVLLESDVIIIATPLNEETKGLLSEREFALMQRCPILVNCAREGIVDREAVLKALQQDRIWGYGIELDLDRPFDPSDPYLSHPRVIITPHTAFYGDTADADAFDYAIENIEAFLAGKPLRVVT